MRVKLHATFFLQEFPYLLCVDVAHHLWWGLDVGRVRFEPAKLNLNPPQAVGCPHLALGK
jgi:hypothetical protein